MSAADGVNGTAHCPACDGTEHAMLAVLSPDGERSYRIRRCSECGHGVLDPVPSAAELERAYSDVDAAAGTRFVSVVERVLDAAARGEAARLVRKLPPHNRSVLDVGCGRGKLANAIVQLGAARGVSCTGVERSAAAAVGLDARVRLVVAPSLAEAAHDAEQHTPARNGFGAVVFRHTLEHMTDINETLAAAHGLLAPGGLLWIEVPNASSSQAAAFGDVWLHWDPPRHVHHFTPHSLRAAVTRVGFEVERVDVGALVHDVAGFVCGRVAKHDRSPHIFYRALHAGGAARLDRLRVLAQGAIAVPRALIESAWSRSQGDGAAIIVEARRR